MHETSLIKLKGFSEQNIFIILNIIIILVRGFEVLADPDQQPPDQHLQGNTRRKIGNKIIITIITRLEY